MNASNYYTLDELRLSLQSVGLRKGDTVFMHSNVAWLGKLVNAKSLNQIAEQIINCIVGFIGPSGTLVLPSFTYSHSSNKPFDYNKTPSNCGCLSEYLRLNGGIRNEDPNVSIVSYGLNSKHFALCSPINTYSSEGIFALLEEFESKLLNINFNSASTYLHYIERCQNVPYRFDKSFSNLFIKENIQEIRKSSIFVRDISTNSTIPNFNKFHTRAINEGYAKQVKCGNGFLSYITFKNTKKVAVEGLHEDANFLINGKYKNP